MKTSKMIKKLLKDPLHWAGWALSTAAIVGVLKLFGGLSEGHIAGQAVSVFVTVVVVDVFKHAAKLQ